MGSPKGSIVQPFHKSIVVFGVVQGVPCLLETPIEVPDVRMNWWEGFWGSLLSELQTLDDPPANPGGHRPGK